MRLIDADKIDFGKVFIGASDFAKDIREASQKLIHEQATAYDTDKVIEEIREYADNVAELGGNFLPKVVIEIVKSGGVADD